MLRLARLLNDATSGERLRLFEAGVIGKIVDMVGEYSKAAASTSGQPPMPAPKRGSPEPPNRSQRSTKVALESGPGIRLTPSGGFY